MRRARIAVLALALFAAGVLPATAAGAATWIVKGGGFGHGVGMSAYGAYGYGLHGASYKQILGHYFQGIGLTEMRSAPLVRVLLTTSSGDVSFSGAISACRQRLQPSRRYTAHRRGSSLRLLSSSGKLLARCGERLHADSASMIRIEGVGVYRGALETVPSGGSLNVVNVLNVNNYARGSLPAEVPPEWPLATLRAFAIAQRSVALSTDVGGEGYDLYPDTRTQVYEGVAVESERTDRAVQSTKSQVATYGGELYGTLKSEIERIFALGRHAVLDVEIEGARQIRRNFPNSLLLFVLPPSAEALVERLVGRNTEDPALVRERIIRAADELAAVAEYDYAILNEDLVVAVAQVAAILEAESWGVSRQDTLPDFIGQLRGDVVRAAEKFGREKTGGRKV